MNLSRIFTIAVLYYLSAHSHLYAQAYNPYQVGSTAYLMYDVYIHHQQKTDSSKIAHLMALYKADTTKLMVEDLLYYYLRMSYAKSKAAAYSAAKSCTTLLLDYQCPQHNQIDKNNYYKGVTEFKSGHLIAAIQHHSKTYLQDTITALTAHQQALINEEQQLKIVNNELKISLTPLSADAKPMAEVSNTVTFQKVKQKYRATSSNLIPTSCPLSDWQSDLMTLEDNRYILENRVAELRASVAALRQDFAYLGQQKGQTPTNQSPTKSIVPTRPPSYGKELPTISADNKYPQFPFPPPTSSGGLYTIDTAIFSRCHFLADAEILLRDALKKCGYAKRTLYQIPSGFAVVTEMEQIDEKGKPLPNAKRWSSLPNTQPEFHFSLNNCINYLTRFFVSRTGYFRILVFTFTSNAVSTDSNIQLVKNEAEKWAKNGMPVLPCDIGCRRYNSNYTCTAMVYEFQVTENREPLLLSQHHDIEKHLQSSGLLWFLSKH